MHLRSDIVLRPPPSGWLLAALVAVLLGLPASTDAGTGSYPSPLYLSNAPSSKLTGSDTLISATAPQQPATTPTTCTSFPSTCPVGGLTGTYQYEYTLWDSVGGETAPSATSTSPNVSSKQITVNNLPTGAGVNVYLYRAKSGGSGSPTQFTRVVTLMSNSSASYTDNMSDATAATQPLLPLSQNRIPQNTTGYQDFSPGNQAPASATTAMDTSSLTTPNGKGWIVDGDGGVSYPAGQWAFQIKLKQNASLVGTPPAGGIAHLVVGMWAVTLSGSAISGSRMLVDPTCSVNPPPACDSEGAGAGEDTTSFITSSGTSTIVHTATVSQFSLASDEHLYVQFWRNEASAQTAGSAANELATMFVYGGTAQITPPAAPTPVPDPPPLVSPADAARTADTTPDLSATYSESDGNPGTLAFQLCSNQDCSTVVQSDTTSSLASGATGTWTPTALAEGTYYWRVQATDSLSNASGWSSTRSFVVDTTPPGTPTLGAPADGTRVSSSTLNATFVDSDSTDRGIVDFELCSNVSCSGIPTTDTSASVSGGTGVSWTPTGLVSGTTYYWRLRATDTAGNQTSWTPTESFVLDTNPPGTPTLVAPGVGVYLPAGAGLSATFSNSDSGDSSTVDFKICSDVNCSTVLMSGSSSSGLADGATGSWMPTGLADGTYYWQAQARDEAGNRSAWSTAQEFLRDVTPPTTPTLPAIPEHTTTVPTLTATYADPPANDAGTLTFQLCSTSTCTSVLRSSSNALASGAGASWTPPVSGDGTYYVRVVAEDAAGNVSYSAVSVFNRDTTPPPAPVLGTVSGMRVHAAPQLIATVIEPSNPGDSSRLLVELCTDPACTSIATTGYSGFVSVDTPAGWQAPSLHDGVYYWRALAEDATGNQSPWSAVASFVVDTVAPAVPALGGPAAGAAVNTPHLTGVPGTPASGVGFEVCADAACANVVASGYAFSPATGAAPSWTPTGLSDGTYFWRIDAHDLAGNASAWSETKSFVLDQTPPGMPRELKAKVTGMTLTLRWRTPKVARHLVGYALLVNGKRMRTLTLKTHMVRIQLRRSETRVFSVVAVDAAGNVSRPTKPVGADPRH